MTNSNTEKVPLAQSAKKQHMNPALLLSYATIVMLWSLSPYIPIEFNTHLLLLVTSILYAACHTSLALRKEQALSRGEVDPTEPVDGPKKPPPISETLRAEDAMQFPIVGSMSLFGLYCAIKFFDKEVVNFLLSAYFGLMGCAAVTSVLSAVTAAIFGGPLRSKRFQKEILVAHKLPAFIGGDSPWDLSYDFSLGTLMSFFVSSGITALYLHKKHWTMNNVLGICFCLKGIESLSLGSYKIGSILLVGLFFYDIFWVFGTDVMVTVAKSIDGPIKILFPKSLTPDPETLKIPLSLLGLGDIVIPGFFLALLLRFDAHNANVPYFPVDIHQSFPKPYFHTTLAGYFVGMATTMFVMIRFEAAQPALLYLVPACLISSMGVALVKGEVKALFEYSEEQEEEDEIAVDSKGKKEGEGKEEDTEESKKEK